MKVRTPPIPLSEATPADRLIKRSARHAFKAVRLIAGRIGEVPGILSQAATDVREAWQESAGQHIGPNA